MDLLLCIDDDPITIMLSKMVMTRAAYANEIVTAQNGEEALAYLDRLMNENSPIPDLIFLDLNMPIMGGWEFLDAFSEEKYRGYFAKSKVVVLSSTIDPRDIEKSKSYEMVLDFMSKPISKELLELVKSKLEA
ncbi:MAG: response regulator [Flavobacterium sp.]|nr:response regulator [Flavobacterium sp.]